MKLSILKDQLFELINDSDIAISDIETNDKQNTMKITTYDGNAFLISLQEMREQQNIPLEHNCSVDEIITEYMATHTKEDYLKDLETLYESNPFLFQIMCCCAKLQEMELMSDAEYHRIMYELSFHQQQLRQDYIKELERKRTFENNLSK